MNGSISSENIDMWAFWPNPEVHRVGGRILTHLHIETPRWWAVSPVVLRHLTAFASTVLTEASEE